MLEVTTLKITTDNTFLDNQNHITPYIAGILEKLHFDAKKGKKGVIDKLIKFSTRYPKTPVFKNYLTTAYAAQGRYEKANECNQWLVKEHPEYLFGKVNLVTQYCMEEAYDKALDVLGVSLNLQELYPNREEFHEDEVMAYYLAVVQYQFGIDDEEQAEEIISMLEEMNPNHPKLEMVPTIRNEFVFRKARIRRAKELELIRMVDVIDRRSMIQTTVAPILHFPEELAILYASNISIATESIEVILALDSVKLEVDLIALLQDSIRRFDYFEDIRVQKGWEEEVFNFPTHALLLLPSVNNGAGLETIFDMLRQDDEYRAFWFGDTLVELIEPLLFQYAKTNLSDLLLFVKEPHIFCFNKAIVTDAVNQLLLHEEEYRTVIMKWNVEVLDFFIVNNDDPTLGDTEFLGLFISDLMDVNATECLPQIKKLFEMEAVGYWVCGEYEDVEAQINQVPNIKKKNSILETAQERYTAHLKQWYQEDSEVLDSYHNHFIDSYDDEPIVNTIKVGRNDPCPCGSGKKYKKCCINLS